MQNFPVKVEDKEYWISRSVAVVGFIFTKINNEYYVLGSQRGTGADGNQGLWNAPCGYLDYDETLKEACSREISEETNLYVSPMLLHYHHIDDKPEGRQNISVSYWAYHPMFMGHTIYPKGTEENEVAEVLWIPLREICNFKWAFNHKYWIANIALDNWSSELDSQTYNMLNQIVIYDDCR